MAQQAISRPEFVPHLPNLIVSMSRCWLAIRDAQTEVDPFAANFEALEEARVALEALADRLTGQGGFLSLAPRPSRREAPSDLVPF